MKRVSGSSGRSSIGKGIRGTRFSSSRGYTGGRYHGGYRYFFSRKKLPNENPNLRFRSYGYVQHAWVYKLIATVVTFGLIGFIAYLVLL